MPTPSATPSPRPPTAPSGSRRCWRRRCGCYHNGEIGLLPLLKAMTINPATLLGLPSGRLEKGAPADLILVDLGQPWVVDKDELRSRSKNSPFDESKMQGRVLRPWLRATVFVAGEKT